MKWSIHKGVHPQVILLIFLCSILHSRKSEAEPSGRPGFYFEEGKHKTTFKFLSVANLIVIPVTLEGTTVNLILDTGMSSIILFHKTSLTKVKVDPRNTITFSGLGNNKPIQGIRIDNLSLDMPGINGSGLSVVRLKSTMLPKSLGKVKIDGVFGYELFSRFIITIDYENQLITMTDPKSFQAPNEASAIPIDVVNAKPFVQTFVTIEETTLPMKLLVDTGASTTLMIGKHSIKGKNFKTHYSRQLGIGMGGILTGRSITVNNIQLGHFQVSKDFRAQLPSEKDYPASDGTVDRDGTLGGGILSQFKVTFDYFNMRLYISSPHKDKNRIGTLARIEGES